MKKYKRILAVLMAASLITNTVTIDVMAETTSAKVSQTEEKEESVSEENSAIEEDESVSEETKQSENAEINENASKAEEPKENIENKETENTEEQTNDTSINDEETDGAENVVSESDENEANVSVQAVTLTLQDLITNKVIEKYEQEGGKISSVTIDSSEAAAGQMIKLSNCTPSDLQNLTINLSVTGTIDLTKSVDGYSYKSIGAEDGFKGIINGTSQIVLKTPLFDVVSSSAIVSSALSIKWAGDGTVPMYANTYLFADETEHEFPIQISPYTDNVTMGSLIGIVGKENETCGTLKIGDKITYKNGNKNVTVAPSRDENTGLLCGKIASGTLKLDGYQFPTQAYTATSNKNNAGGLIGEMGKDTVLEMNLQNDVSLDVKVTASAGSAGGLVGVSGENAQCNVTSENNKITLKNLSVSGKINVGGIFGSYTLSGEEREFPGWLKINNNTVAVSLLDAKKAELGKGNAGGLFGVINLQNGAQYKISNINLTSTIDGFGTAYGAVAGQVKCESTAENKLSSFQIIGSSSEQTEDIVIDSTNTKKTYYHGGLIGLLGEKTSNGEDANKAVYLEVSNVSVTVNNPYAGDDTELGFGGIVGHEAAGCVVKTDKLIKISTEGSDPRIWEGGGLVGYVGNGSALELNGTTDLIGTSYESTGTVGQLVGKQENALIYARGDGNGNGNGWTYKRTKKNNISNKDQSGRQGALDDIGNYGEVIRLKDNSENANAGLSKDLIKLDAVSHKVSIKGDMDYMQENIQLKDADEFALLAITWQSQGAFKADTKLNDWKTLKGKNITLTGNIDLTGTGITGLTRDNTDNVYYQYEGKFDGGEKTITLAIGEAYGFQENEKASGDSSGSIHRHYYEGIFATLGGTSEVKNLTISGIINTDPMPVKRTSTDTECWVGAYAGKVNSSVVNVENVTVKQSMNLSADRTFYKVIGVYAGGLLGQISSECTLNMGTKNQVVISPKIEITNSEANEKINIKDSADVIYAGGAVGMLVGSSKIIVNCNKVKLSGEVTSSTEKKAQSGGLIGYADYGTTKTINIRKLELNGQNITAKTAKECGGLLGYLWADTDVNFITPTEISEYALDVKNSKVELENDKASAGGLVYRASGKWTVNNRGISMSNNEFQAENLGFLVCHAENDESETRPNGDANYDRQKALYLEMTENWKTAYNLKDIKVTSSGVTDEIIAYTAKDAASITNNRKNGIISLATEKHQGVAIGNECNTYQNRILVDKTNGCSRYYYNLDTIKESSQVKNDTEQVDNSSKLLIWSVRRYASNNLKNNFGDKEYWTIEITDNNSLDMEGLSYYPIDISSIYINNVQIIFYNSEIEANETKNKSTKGNSGKHTQHYMMHCGLFYNMYALNSEEDPDRKNTSANIKKLSFSGTVGKVNGGSGALVCGGVYGQRDNTNIINNRLYTLTLDNVNLKNIKVTGDTKEWNGYAPVLINSSGNYSTINFNNIYTEAYVQGEKAGTSLMGNAGGEDMTQISLSFSAMHLSDTSDKNGIFTQATFLNKFQYSASGIGSASYNFEKSEEWTGSEYSHTATYGKEISDSIEYAERQRKYYDEESQEAENDGYVGKDTTQKNSFIDYLPYVKVGNTETLCHEIRVNQRLSDLLIGCGTYGHPYVITKEGQMTTISNYLAQGNPQIDWKVTITNNQEKLHDNEQNDITYKYVGNNTWQHIEKTTIDGKEQWNLASDGKTLANTVMYSYLLSAYYDIQGQEKENNILKLTNFGGLGTEDNPFRGVLVSTKKSTIELSGTVSTGGLIAYSYGSVIKDINIKFTGEGYTVTYNVSEDETIEAGYQPQKVFGGVIGCIVGGDNIIDNVSVSMDEGWSLTLDGNKNYLIQTGGYIGSIAGGGVIFRNKDINEDCLKGHVKAGTAAGCSTISTDGDASDEKAKSLYVNPVIGRVLDGYAFSEYCTVENGTKNYKINSLTGFADEIVPIETTIGQNNDARILIKNKKGLLVLSAIINSGGASGGNTYTYGGSASAESTTELYKFGTGSYGKVRNATYFAVGDLNKEGAHDDFGVSMSDDRNAPSSTNEPYLVNEYTTNLGMFNISDNKKNVSFSLVSEADYDMTDYGNGYQGISARYLSSAVNAGSDKNGSVYAKPLVKNFDGDNATIITNINVKEYADDDYHGISFGGVFNLLRAVESDEKEGTTLLQNLNIGTNKQETNNKKTCVRLQYCNAEGENEKKATSLEEMTGLYCVGVGGFAGNTAANGVNSSSKSKYYFKKVKIKNGEFIGPNTAGGLFGSVGMGGDAEIKATSGIALLLQNIIKNDKNQIENTNCLGINLENCLYSDLVVKSSYASGGFIGYIGKNNWNFYDVSKSDYLESSFNVTTEEYQQVGKDSEIEATDTFEILPYTWSTTKEYVSVAGGIIGKVNTALKINDTKNSIEASLENNSIISKKNAGGVLGQLENNNCEINKLEVEGTSTTISCQNNAGGIAGYISSNDTTTLFKECKVTAIKVIGASKDTKSGAGGIIGTVKGVLNDKEVIQIENCIVSGKTGVNGSSNTVQIESIKSTNSGVGGVLGYLTGQQRVVVQGCAVKNASINTEENKDGYNGGIVGTMEYNGNADYCKKEKLSLYDLSVSDTKIYGTEAGSLMSSAYGAVDGSNLQINNVQVSGTDSKTEKTGILIGGAGSLEKVEHLYLAGVSIKGKTWAKIGNGKPSYERLTHETGSFKFGTNSYISFADYSGASLDAKDSKDLLDTSSASPYVVTSPKSPLKVVDKEGKEKYLYGDGAFWNSSGKTMGETIYEEKDSITNDGNEENGSTKNNKFLYKTTGVESFNFTSAFGTYNSNNNENKIDNSADFPVLQIAGGDTSNITSYLNILTNGGYSQAVPLGKVSVKTELYEYDNDTKEFKYSKEASPLTVSGSKTKDLNFTASSDYDNDKQRFTLLTVTFMTDDDKHCYNVQIPVIVKRVLEVDFTATLSYGTHFKSSDYNALTGHILDSFGNTMTAYLTYTYNSANDKLVKYGWDNYIKAGGNVAQSMEKNVKFNQGQDLPEGTQLTLIDCQDDKKIAYYYTVTGEDAKSKTISFDEFVSSDNKKYQSKSIGVCIGVTAEEKTDGSGIFVKVENKEEATVAVQNELGVMEYYRLAKSTDGNAKRYLISAPETEKQFSENYYLVISMPEKENQQAVNGSIETSLSGDIPNHINYILRNKDSEGNIQEDNHSNTASTYYITSGYSQSLQETIEGSVKLMSAADSKVKVGLKDTITFPNGQYYNKSDQLYQSFTGLLQSGAAESMKASQFPTGTSGKTNFYVYTEKNNVKTYYRWDGKNWNPIKENETDKIAVSYDWESDGGNMELPLGTDQNSSHAISLQQIRDNAKNGTSDTGYSSFYIELELEASIPANGLSVIPESVIDTATNNPKEYAKMNYISKLSTETASLSYSNTKITLTETAMKYYREKTDGAKLNYDADEITQLGINLLDLEPNLDKDKTHAVIATTARYDLSAIENLKQKLESSTGIKFTLTLKKKKKEQAESYEDEILKNAKEQYMDIQLTTPSKNEPEYKDGTWTWEIPKESYWDADKKELKTDSVVFDGNTFTQAIRLLINIKDVDWYSNYKVDLTASVKGVDGTNQSDNIIYTLTKINLKFEE